MSDTTLFLFRNDLRLQDNAALTAACDSEQDVILLYIFDEEAGVDNEWPMGSASRWWLHHSLESLMSSIEYQGGCLALRKGKTLDVLDDVIKQASVNKLCFSRMYEPRLRDIEDAIYARWHNQIDIKRYGGYLLFEPEQIRTGNDQSFKVFTPFWKACLREPEPHPSKSISKTNFNCVDIESDELKDWGLLPSKPDWATGFQEDWLPGEAGAHLALKNFIDTGIDDYEVDRDRPDRNGTSCLSPHLHFGELAPARIWQQIKKAIKNRDEKKQKNAMAYLRELAWRDFSNQLLFHWPDFPTKPFRQQFASFPWVYDPESLAAWQKGQTGYPIVDAGMRQLWQTGWMHNRVRMIVASFLVKHLMIHWREGEDWFWDTLVDADLANNSASWQWVAGSGADAAPYFRIFNPILQGKKFDPDGDYVSKWVPEISGLSKKYIHEPWQASELELEQAGIVLGRDYPEPIVDHASSRNRALEAYQQIK